MALELIPIGTILAVLMNQVLKTAQAAREVLFEKDSFRVLSRHLADIEPVLRELQRRELNDSQAARLALESLEANVTKANNLVEKYRSKARFYLLVKCRHIVKEVQQVTRDLGQSLATLSLTNAEVLAGISHQVDRLQNEMQRVELDTSRSHLHILDRLDQGIKEQKSDQGFANELLEEIARAVGVPVEPSEISKEMESFRKEKEEAAARKERAEELFLGQVIELLSRADAARDYKEVKSRYLQRVRVIEKYDSKEEYIPPLNAFTCPIIGIVMVDPVSLPTGTTCERAAIEGRLAHGVRTDPETGEFLHQTSLRSNIRLRQSIEEWRELNYCLGIRSCRAKLLSGYDPSVDEALARMGHLMREDSVNKDWVSIGGLIDIAIDILGNSHNKDVKCKVLATLKHAVEGHPRNKEQVVESKAWDLIIPCLGRDASVSKAAVGLLYELLQDRSGWNLTTCRKLSQQGSAIIFLVTLLRGSVPESAEYSEKILAVLFEVDDENISRVARAGWYKPLIARIVQGSESLRISSVKSLIDMELVDSSLELIGKEGIIPPLLEMTSGNFEAKELSLSALVRVLGCRANKEIMAAAGGVCRIIELMTTPQEHIIIITRCCEILERLTSEDDGTRFIVDHNGCRLEPEIILTKLLEFLKRCNNTSQSVLKPAVRTILAICKLEPELVKKAVMTATGISAILPLLDVPDSKVREVAVSLLFHFSQHEPEGVVEYLLRPRRLEVLVGFLENAEDEEVQMAAAGLLANLPKSETALTMKLIELEGLGALIKILRCGKMQAKENALSALFRFTDPVNIDSQHIAVSHGLYPLLVNILRVGSTTAKASAAAHIGNLSFNSPKLSVPTTPSRLCFCFQPRVPLCPAHGGVCSVESTFCLLNARALPYLVDLLDREVGQETAHEAIQALSTLVREGPTIRGASVLHEAGAIKPVLEILTWGTEPLKEEALEFLEMVFRSKEMVELYGSSMKLLLASITGRNICTDGNLGRAAVNVLALIERYSKSSTSIIPGLFA